MISWSGGPSPQVLTPGIGMSLSNFSAG
jgi:hypothetical protein